MEPSPREVSQRCTVPVAIASPSRARCIARNGLLAIGPGRLHSSLPGLGQRSDGVSVVPAALGSGPKPIESLGNDLVLLDGGTSDGRCEIRQADTHAPPSS